MVRVAGEGRGTNKNASPAGIEKSLGGVTGRRYTQRDSRGCVPVARARAADLHAAPFQLFFVTELAPMKRRVRFTHLRANASHPAAALDKMAAVNRAYSSRGN